MTSARRADGPQREGAIEVFIRRSDAERFIEEVRGGEPEIAGYLRIAERASEAGG